MITPLGRIQVSNPAPKHVSEPDCAPDLLAFQRRAAEEGWMVQLPSADPDWELPEPADLGASVGDMVVRLRRAEP
jgi:hypothetical protein